MRAFPPQEIELFNQRARLKEEISNTQDTALRTQLLKKLSALEQVLAFRLEKLRQMGRG